MDFFANLIRRGLGIDNAQKALQWVGENAPTQVTTPIIQAERVLKAPPMLQVPRYEAPNYLPSTVKYMADLLHPQNIAGTLAETVVNTPGLLSKGVMNTGELLADRFQRNERVPLTSYVKSIAPFIEGLANIGTMGIGGGIAKSGIESVAKPVVKQGFKALAGNILRGGAKMAAEGAGIGAGYGALSGIQADVPDDSVGEMLDRAISGAAQGAKAGAIAGPVVGGTLKLGGKLLGKAKIGYEKMTPEERQAGFIDPNAPVGKQFKAPYKRGDIGVLEKQLDATLGTEQYMNGKWNSRLPARQKAFQALEYYAGQGEQGDIDALSKARALESDLIKAQTAKTASIPEVKTVTGKSMKQILAKKKAVPTVEPIVEAPFTARTPPMPRGVDKTFRKSSAYREWSGKTEPSKKPTVKEMIQNKGPGPLPWEEAGYPGVKNPDAVPSGFKLDKKGNMVPRMNTIEARQKGDIAELQAVGNKPKTIESVKRYFGKLEATETKGAAEGYKLKDIPKGVEPMDVVHALENPNGKHSDAIKQYLSDYRKLDDEVFAAAKKAGYDINYLRDHVTHFWQNSSQEINEAYKRFSKSYSGTRKIPTYAEGIELGLTPRYTNPAQILAESVKQLERAKAGMELFTNLRDQGVLVPATVGSRRPGFEPINAPGFVSNVSRVNEELAIKGNWYAPTEIASVLNRAFSPEANNGSIGRMLSIGSKISSKLQDVTTSGGVPFSPGNAFTAANFIKEFTAGRVASPVKAFVRSLSDKSSKDFFAKHSGQIVKMQERDIPINTSLNIADLAKGKTSLGGLWDKAVNDPTFKRFMPMLQINLFNDIEKQALKMGKSPEIAADIAAKAVKQFYGSGSTFSNLTRSQLTKDVMGTFLFAPKFRESMVNFWLNNVKSLAHPLALENRTNVKFLAGSLMTIGAMNYLNEQFTGHSMLENPAGTQDKLLIPMSKITGDESDDTVIGVPFLSSIATVPRALFTAGMDVVKGDPGRAITRLGQTGASILVKPLADVANNEDYFGRPIYTDDMTTQEKYAAQGKYLFTQYVLSHPYLKETLNKGNADDPAYQRLSRAMELPFRFYTDANLKSKYYYAERENAINGLSPQEQNAFNSIPKSDTNDPNTRILKYQIFLTYPSVFEAKQKIEIQTAAKTGRAIDPLYLVNYDLAKKYMRYEALPEGSPDRKALTAANPELTSLFKARSQFFNENPIEGQQQSARPIATPEQQAAMDRKDWNYPGVKDYLNAVTKWNNQQREKLELPAVEGGGSGSNKVSNFLKYDKYKWSNLKAKNKSKLKKSVNAIIKGGKKPKQSSVKTVKPPKFPTRKSIIAMLKKKPKTPTFSYKFMGKTVS